MCSAGVGRTGTLVALDSLLQQLEAEGQVTIFSTVCDLRHQRNFLVQSLVCREKRFCARLVLKRLWSLIISSFYNFVFRNNIFLYIELFSKLLSLEIQN